MNLSPAHSSRRSLHVSRLMHCRRRQTGSAVIVVMALLAIILVYVAGNLRMLHNLGGELKLLERQQTRRLQRAAQTTNTPAAITVVTNAVPGPPAR